MRDDGPAHHTAPPVPSTVVQVEEVHHPVYVDQYGNPIDPASVPGFRSRAAESHHPIERSDQRWRPVCSGPGAVARTRCAHADSGPRPGAGAAPAPAPVVTVSAPAAPAGVLGLDVLIEDPHWRERRGWAMGSPAHLIVGGGASAARRLGRRPSSSASSSAGAASARTASSRGSRRPAGGWVPVSADLLGGARPRAHRLWRHTMGAFDPTVGAALASLGYDRTFAAVEPASGGRRAPSRRRCPGSVPSSSTRSGPRCACPRGRCSTSGGSARAWPPTWSPRG